MAQVTGAIRDRLDLWVALTVFSVGATITYLGFTSDNQATAEMGIAALAASFIYILFRKRMSGSAALAVSSSRALVIVLNLIFLLAITASVALMATSLFRPPLYFILISIAVAAIAYEIVAAQDRVPVWLILLKIMVIAFVIRAGLFYEMPGYLGNDAWFHASIVESWLESGRIDYDVANIFSGYTGYADFPLMHLAIMATNLVTSLSLKDSFFFSIGLFSITSLMFVYLIGQRLLDKTAGLLAALLATISVPLIVWGAILIPTSMGVALFAMLLFLLFKRQRSVTNIIVFIIVVITLVFTHTVSAFVTLLALGSIYIANQTYKWLSREKLERLSIGMNAVFLYGILLFTHWSTTFYYPTQSFFEAVTLALFKALRLDTEFVGSVVHVASESWLNRLWFLLFIALIIIGVLVWSHRRSRTNLRLAIIAGGATLAIITFVLPLFNIENFVPGRWIPFIFIICAVPAAQGLISLSSVTRTAIAGAMAVVLVVFGFSLLSLNSSTVNAKAPFLEEPVQVAFNQSELTAAATLVERYGERITTDWDYAELVFRTQTGTGNLVYLDPAITTEGIVVLRDYIIRHPERMEYHWRKGQATVEETRALLASFNDNPEYNLLYSNSRVAAYMRR